MKYLMMFLLVGLLSCSKEEPSQTDMILGEWESGIGLSQKTLNFSLESVTMTERGILGSFERTVPYYLPKDSLIMGDVRCLLKKLTFLELIAFERGIESTYTRP